MDKNYDFQFKIVLVGDTCTGKTNLITKYLNNQFNENSKATVGVEYGKKILSINNISTKAQIWDLARQEEYRSLTSSYY